MKFEDGTYFVLHLFSIHFTSHFIAQVQQQESQFIERLTELESAIAERKNKLQFNTPSVPIIGLNVQSAKSVDTNNGLQIPSDVPGEMEDDAGSESTGLLPQEYASDHSDIVDLMEDLEDSTDGPSSPAFMERL